MKKIDEGLYIHKGVKVMQTIEGNYISELPVNNWRLPIKIVGATQKDFKKIFNDTVKQYGGLRGEA